MFLSIAVYTEDIRDLCNMNGKLDVDYYRDWRAIIVFVPVELGATKVDPHYFPQIFNFLLWKNSIGMIGTHLHKSLYFVGYQGKFTVFYIL